MRERSWYEPRSISGLSWVHMGCPSSDVIASVDALQRVSGGRAYGVTGRALLAAKPGGPARRAMRNHQGNTADM